MCVFCPSLETVLGAYVNSNCKAVILCDLSAVALEYTSSSAISTPGFVKRSQILDCVALRFICHVTELCCLLEFGKELPFTVW